MMLKPQLPRPPYFRGAGGNWPCSPLPAQRCLGQESGADTDVQSPAQTEHPMDLAAAGLGCGSAGGSYTLAPPGAPAQHGPQLGPGRSWSPGAGQGAQDPNPARLPPSPRACGSQVGRDLPLPLDGWSPGSTSLRPRVRGLRGGARALGRPCAFLGGRRARRCWQVSLSLFSLFGSDFLRLKN